MDSLLAKSPCRNNVILGAEFIQVEYSSQQEASYLFRSRISISYSVLIFSLPKIISVDFFCTEIAPRKGGKDTREVLTLSTEVELPHANILHVDALGYMNQHLDDRCYPWLSPGYHLVTHDNTYISYEHVHEVLWNCESHGGIKHRLSSAQDCR